MPGLIFSEKITISQLQYVACYNLFCSLKVKFLGGKVYGVINPNFCTWTAVCFCKITKTNFPRVTKSHNYERRLGSSICTPCTTWFTWRIFHVWTFKGRIGCMTYAISKEQSLSAHLRSPDHDLGPYNSPLHARVSVGQGRSWFWLECVDGECDLEFISHKCSSAFVRSVQFISPVQVIVRMRRSQGRIVGEESHVAVVLSTMTGYNYDSIEQVNLKITLILI